MTGRLTLDWLNSPMPLARALRMGSPSTVSKLVTGAKNALKIDCLQDLVPSAKRDTGRGVVLSLRKREQTSPGVKWIL
jgi:hypothetical protein